MTSLAHKQLWKWYKRILLLNTTDLLCVEWFHLPFVNEQSPKLCKASHNGLLQNFHHLAKLLAVSKCIIDVISKVIILAGSRWKWFAIKKFDWNCNIFIPPIWLFLMYYTKTNNFKSIRIGTCNITFFSSL